MHIFRFAAVAVTVVASAAVAHAQPTAPRDSTFEEHLRDSWRQATAYEGTNRDSLWRALAAEPFAYYQAHPDTPTGRKAIETAFTMWGNTDAADEVTGAVALLDDDSDLWAAALHGVANAHARAGRRDEYAALLGDLGSRLTHPRAQTAVWTQLGERELFEGRDAEARPYFERVAAADADSFGVAKATGYLYEIDHLGLGMAAPDFSATTLGGAPLRLADLRGRVVLLDFWATWCGPCLPEIPHLSALHAAYPEDVVVVGISLDRDKDDLLAMIEDRDMDWPHIWEEDEWKGEVAMLYNVNRLPQTFLIDCDGRIVAKNLRGEAMEERVAEARAK